MKNKQTSFEDYYIDVGMDYVGLLCAMGKYYDFELVFTWSKNHGFDVEPKSKTVARNNKNEFHNKIRTSFQDLSVWNDNVRIVEETGRERFGGIAKSLITPKLAAAYIYMQLVKGLSREKVRDLNFSGVEMRNNQIHYIFDTQGQSIEFHFRGAEMDAFLEKKILRKQDKWN